MKALKAFVALLALASTLAGLTLAHHAVEAAGQTTTQAAFSKQAMIANVTRNVVLPGYVELAARSGELATAADHLASSPSAVTLKQAQQAWTKALLAWRRVQSFVQGPVLDLGVHGTLQFWPLRTQSIERVLREKRPIDSSYVEELGANAVGLFPLENLLFDTRHDEAALLNLFAGPQGERRRRYVQVVAHDLAAKTRRVERAWQGTGGYAAKLGSGGQDSLNLLINDMLFAIELGAQERLRLVVDWHSVNLLSPEMVEGGRSGTSQQGLLELLTGAERTFNGGGGVGIDDYLKQLQPSTARRVETQFRKAIAAVQAIGGPLDQKSPAAQQAVKQAHAECRALELLLKVDVASILGVTITFKAVDGD